MSQPRTMLVTNVLAFCGLPAAKALAESGATVVCHDRAFADLGALATFARAHPELNPIAQQSPQAVAATLDAEWGGLSALVSNDAHPAERAPIDTASPDALRAAIEDLTVFPFMLCGAVVPQMKRRGSGHIVFIGSAAPLRGIANYSVYCAARGATNSLARSLALELAPHNISVNMVAANFIESPTYFPRALMDDPATRAKILRQVPLNRLGRPEEVAALVVLLASGNVDFMTGQILPVAGGWA